MAPKFTEKRVGQFMFDQFETAFASRVMSRRKEIEEDTKAVYKKFFEDMAGFVGDNRTPSWVTEMGEDEWKDISPGWIDRKRGTYENQFYKGIGPQASDEFKGGSYKSELLSRTPDKRYGPLKLDVKVGKSGAEWNPKSRRFHYGGKFVSGANAGVTVVINAFSWVKKDEDLQRGFSQRIQNILQRNEPWGSSSLKHGIKRPFLTPMVRYYTEVKLPNAVREAVR